MTRTRFVITAALALALVTPAAYGAGWTPAVSVAPTSPSTAGTANSHLAVNSRGDQVVIWDDMQDQGADADTCAHSEVATRVAGGNWSTPVVVPCDAQTAIGPSGGALVFWHDTVSGAAKAATAQAGSSFGAAVTADSSSSVHDGLTGAVDAQGIPTLAWAAGTYGTGTLSAKTADANGNWSLPVQLVAGTAPGRAYSYPALAIGPQGDAVIAAENTTYISPTTTYAFAVYARAANASSWTGTTLLGPVTNYQIQTAEVAFDPQNRPTVMVVHGYATFELSAWTRSDGTWSAKQTVDSGTSTPYEFSFALDSNGNAQVAYWFTNYSMKASSRSAGYPTWSSPATLLASCAVTPRGDAPSVAFDAQDNALIGFTCGSTQYTLQRLAGSSSYAAFTGPAGASGVSYTTDPNGYLIATWTANGATFTSVYDAVAPTVDNFAPQSTPVAGQPVTFDVGGSDVWGPVSYTVDFGDGSPVATGRVFAAPSARILARVAVAQTVTHTYANAGNYTATITVSDSAANTATTSRAVSVAAAPVPLPPVVVPGLPDPIAGKTVNVFPVVPPVYVKQPLERKFTLLTQPSQIRVGSIIDTRKGRVRITIDNGLHGFDTADFYQGMFKLLQRPAPSALASLQLFGGKFKGCAKAPRVKISRLSKKRSVRHLWGAGKGKFRTVGRFSSATIRGTNWLTDDRCNGTLTRVKQGSVSVRDFVKKRNIVVKAPKKYLARPKRR